MLGVSGGALPPHRPTEDGTRGPVGAQCCAQHPGLTLYSVHLLQVEASREPGRRLPLGLQSQSACTRPHIRPISRYFRCCSQSTASQTRSQSLGVAHGSTPGVSPGQRPQQAPACPGRGCSWLISTETGSMPRLSLLLLCNPSIQQHLVHRQPDTGSRGSVHLAPPINYRATWASCHLIS